MADDKKPAPAAKAPDATDKPAMHDTHGQARTEQRLRNETKAAKKDGEPMVKLRTTAGVEQEVTEARWKAEAQTLRQEGFERADLLDAADDK